MSLIGFQVWKFREVSLDDALGFSPWNLQGFGQSKRTLTIQNAKIDRLGLTPLSAIDLLWCDPKYFGCRCRVDVRAIQKSLAQAAVSAQSGHNPQLHLTVVRREQYMLRIPWHKSLPDFTATCRADGDVLKIRVRTTQTTCGRYSLHILGVDALCLGIDKLGQGPHVRGQQFVELSVLQHFGNNRVGRDQLLQNVFACCVLPGLGLLCLFGDHQVIEQNFAQLTGRVDGKGNPRMRLNRFRQLSQVLLEAFGHAIQRLNIQPNPFHFHVGQYRNQRHF